MDVRKNEDFSYKSIVCLLLVMDTKKVVETKTVRPQKGNGEKDDEGGKFKDKPLLFNNIEQPLRIPKCQHCTAMFVYWEMPRLLLLRSWDFTLQSNNINGMTWMEMMGKMQLYLWGLKQRSGNAQWKFEHVFSTTNFMLRCWGCVKKLHCAQCAWAEFFNMGSITDTDHVGNICLFLGTFFKTRIFITRANRWHYFLALDTPY